MNNRTVSPVIPKNPPPTQAQRLELDDCAEKWEALFVSLMTLRRLCPETRIKDSNQWSDDLNAHALAIDLIKCQINKIQCHALSIHPNGITINYANIKNI